MNIELILPIAGIIATMFIGYWSVKFASRQKIRTQLLFFENNCISLFKSVVKDLDDIEIKYKNKTIDENLILFKGTLFNSGNCDIDKSIIHKPVSIEIPENYIWTKVKIIDKSEDVAITDKIENNKLILDWDILKENEYITFDSIIEYKPKDETENNSDDYKITKELSNNIIFSHRITNLKSTNKEKIPSKPIGNIWLILLSLYLMTLIGLAMYWSVGQFVFPYYEIQYKIQQDSTSIFAKLKVVDESKIKLIDTNNDLISIHAANDLKLKLLNDIKITKKKINYVKFVTGGLIGILTIFSTVTLVSSELSKKRLYRKIKIIVDKHSKTRLDIDYRRKRL